MKTFYIETLGCKVNQYESEGIAARLEEKGLKRTDKKGAHDICIINTCAVTSKAGMQSRQAIRKLIRDNPDARVIVTGCHAQTDPDLIGKIENISQIVCHKDKTRIADEILNPDGCNLEFKPVNHTKTNRFESFQKPVKGSMSRAYLKIQDGCNAFCSYCIIPYARGSSVSMPENTVMEHLKGLADEGFEEVILTGIHAGLYGRDLNPKTTLFSLMERIDRERPVKRVRLGSIEPNEIEDGLIHLARDGHVLAEHFHIPLQSGDDTILKRMKRPYTRDFFRQEVEKIHGTLPHAGIGIDVIVGFPGETREHFENTYNLLRELPVSYLHVFPFSPRKGTPAFHFDGKVKESEVKERCARLRELDQIKRNAFLEKNKNRSLDCLVQHSTDKASGLLKAVSSNYLTLLAPQIPDIRGKIVPLTYTETVQGETPVTQLVSKS